MTLRSTYFGAYGAKLAEARQSGHDFVTVTNLTTITTAMGTNAASGNKKFTINLPVSYQPADLRALGNLWLAYQTGVQQGLAEQDIMANEILVALNTSDSLNTSIDLKFAF